MNQVDEDAYLRHLDNFGTPEYIILDESNSWHVKLWFLLQDATDCEKNFVRLFLG